MRSFASRHIRSGNCFRSRRAAYSLHSKWPELYGHGYVHVMNGTNRDLLKFVTRDTAPGQPATDYAHGMEWRAEVHAGPKARTASNV